MAVPTHDARSAPEPDNSAEAQKRIDTLREQLLGGRGPGATSEELAPYMHDRVILGSIPATVEREVVADRTQLARGEETEQVQRKIDQERDHLALTVAQIVDRLAPEQLVTRLTRTTRRRVETLLDVPRVVSDEARPAAVQAIGGSARSVADPRWVRVFAVGMAAGAAAVFGIAASVCRRNRDRLARQAIAHRYLT